MTVNYGAKIKVVAVTWRSGEIVGWRAEHDGPNGHEQLQNGEQCECGILNIGIVKGSA